MTVSRENSTEKYLIAGTDPEVVKLYEELPDRAKDLQFGLLEDDIVVLDTETTGLDPASCSLLEIAAIRMRGGERIAEFHTLMNPGRAIPEEITELTGITQDDVEGAPSPREAVAQFAEFVGSSDLVAHNADFDRSFIMRQALPGEFPGNWIDSLTLSFIVLPRLKSHRLVDLARAFNLDAPSHRAMDDTVTLSQLWRILLAGLLAMTPGVANRIAELSPQTDWTLRAYFQQAAQQYPGVDFSLRQNRQAQTKEIALPPRTDADEVPLSFCNEEVIDKAFSESGIIGEMYPGFEVREEQRAMAQEVAASLRQGDIRILEAGTGVGKSMAYLLPLALGAKQNLITTGVATKTNALMDQLVYHELPRLQEALGGLDYVALKGYEHYLCLRKLEHLMRTSEDESAGTLNAITALLNFSAQTSQGDIDALSFNWARIPRADYQANPHDCLKQRCPFYPRLCYLHGARKAAQSADIVVTNHALLFRDMEAENGILPPIRHWVIDEAHSVEGEARRQLSFVVSSQDIESAFMRITSNRSGIIARVRKKAPALEGGDPLFGVTIDIENRIGNIRLIAADFFTQLEEIPSEDARDLGSYNVSTTWISSEIRESPRWIALCEPGTKLAGELRSLNGRLADLISMLEQFEGEFASQLAELTSITSEIHRAVEALNLVLAGTDDRFVYSIQLDRNPRRPSQVLEAMRLDIGETLSADLYPNVRSLIFTSATVATGEREPFAHFMRATGLDRAEDKSVHAAQFASSYDFDRKMTILLPSNMPEPSSQHYQKEFARLLYETHVAMGGSVLTLFTNRREMEALYRKLKPQLADAGIELIAQTRGASTKTLRDRFLEDKSLSLFALKSFWEGFDAPGDTLRCVIIAKLPFGRPNDPLARERESRDGRAAWGKYSLPEAIVELKQAAGRLIRNSTDSGWLILADGRLQTKNYGSAFLRAMPTHDIRTLSIDEIARLMETQDPGLV